MRYLSLFSGIEAATVAWHPLGWEPVAFAERDPFASAVLARHYPDVPNLGDVTQITEAQIKALGHIDVVVGGFPCQDVSMAGKRQGLHNDDGTHTRSGLFYTAMQIVEWSRARWTLLENVPGLYSKNFADVVGAMVGSEFGVPKNKWRTAGVAVGPLGLCEWVCLDAQWFGVAQRRRRVFLVRDAGDWTNRPPLFFEQHCLQGHPAPRREKRQTAPTLPSRSTAGGGMGTDFDCDGGLINMPHMETVGTLSDGAHHGGGLNGQDAYSGRIFPVAQLNRDGALIAFQSNDNEPVVFQPRYARNGRGAPDTVAGPLTAEAGRTGKGDSAQCVAYSIMPMNSGKDFKARETEVAQPVMTTPVGGNQGGDYVVQTTPVAFTDVAGTKQRGGQGGRHDGVMTPTMAVRRLTPVECSRLQQFPDDYLELKYANANEANAAQILHELWREIGAKGVAAQEANFPQDRGGDVCEKRRIATALFTPEVLLAGVHVGWIQWDQARRCSEHQNITHVGAAGWTDGFVRRLREAGEAGCPPYRRESYQQCASELGYPVQELPLETAQIRAYLQRSELWQEAQGAWTLRYAFATPKEIESGKPLMSDGPRYKALGNSMAVPVMQWIGKRIEAVCATMNITATPASAATGSVGQAATGQ